MEERKIEIKKEGGREGVRKEGKKNVYNFYLDQNVFCKI